MTLVNIKKYTFFSSFNITEDHAIPLVHKNENGEFISNLSEIEEILTDPEVRDLKVAIISVAGKYRRGKSFLLNFFLRYLYAKVINLKIYLIHYSKRI